MTTATPVLEVRDLASPGVFTDVDLTVHAGEIVGLAGLVGAGRSEILETLYGARRASAGTVTVDGRKLRPGSVQQAVRAGVGLAPEERKSQGLLLDEAVYKNITVSSMRRFARLGFLNRAEERKQATELTTSLDVRPAGVTRAVRTLSGGNQQKVVLARWLLRDCRVLLLDEPTRGVDVGARSEIYQLIRSLADRGVAVVVVSSEIEEVLGLADRVLVVREGAGRPRVRRHRDRRGQGPRPRHGRKGSGMSQDSARVEQAALETEREREPGPRRAEHQRRPQRGLVVALLLICAVGAITAGDRFASSDNALTILRLAAAIGVVSIGMTFVIIGGGIDLSVGAIVALSSVWCTTVATQTMAEDTHWIVMVVVALLVGAGCGAGQRAADRLRQRSCRSSRRWRCSPARAASPRSSATRRPRSSRVRASRLLQRRLPRRRACRSGCSPWSRSWAGSCSTARRSAAVPSPSAATPRRPAWPASTSSGTPSTSTC